LAGISHDLRTPLARMRLALELLPETVDRKLAARFERNLQAMDDLIGNALRFARGAGETPQNVDLKPFLASMIASIDETMTVTWRGSDMVNVKIALGAFQRVVTNLVSNAQRHAGGATVVVEIGDVVALHVLDCGPGIPASEREKVFQPFYRLDSARSTGGSGLRLAIVHQLCQAHGWTVDLSSRPEGGTDACVTIPR